MREYARDAMKAQGHKKEAEKTLKYWWGKTPSMINNLYLNKILKNKHSPIVAMGNKAFVTLYPKIKRLAISQKRQC